ncbi:MAG: nuclear transport factor 2 family protein [Burkholderiaceae bacterium]|nr:nuclear transport factor 2 family protein [Burkholderiaceae bacterium]
MRKAKLQAANLGGSADDIEAAFYEALQHGDIDQLMACWADEDEILCIHPGGSQVIGSGAIRAAFEAIFANGRINAQPERVHVLSALASSLHSVLERVEIMTPEGPQHAYAIATNVYHKTAQGWRMVAHHASPGSSSDPHTASHQSVVLH